ncbi:MAG TPA: amylo-alpha-1,6-glucosidase, partial [Candidatus Acidoferrales bacterium]|nr:amylo-alpha-1,6-glucosidase [Candidatus Acidoferrales bacterium]
MSQTEAETANVVEIERINGLWAYVLPDNKLVTGSSYGNKKCFVNSKATGAIESLFSLDLGRNVVGSTLVRYYDAESGVALEQTGVGDFIIHPAYQKHKFRIAQGLRISEIFYVPNAPQDGLDQCPAAYLGLKITNKTSDVQRISVVAYADLRPTYLATTRDVEARFCYKNKAIIASNQSNTQWTRFVGTTGKNATFSYTSDISSVTDNFNVTPRSRPSCEQYMGVSSSAEDRCSVQYLPLADESAATDVAIQSEEEDRAVIARIQVDVEVPADGAEQFTFIIGFSASGERDAIRTFELLENYELAYRQTIRHYVNEDSHSVVMTPDRVINRGVQWAKANMARVKAYYPKGWGFTNDPSMSSNIVARDTAWFSFGCDYVAPEFSKRALKAFKRLQSAGGLIPEYYNGVTGEVDDYQLNVNDDTPLYILAVAHTFQITDDRVFLEEMWPSVEKAANYILSQKDERGLVFCRSKGVGVYGICGWRNIIPNHTINGAVTEVNAESFAALRAAALLADFMGDDEKAAYFRAEAKRLKAAINQHLINPKTGYYYLNVDSDGNAHPDVTCDQIFPVIFNVATPATSHLIIDRLNRPDFLTTAGVRTVPRTALNYHPERGWGLTGGVWPDVAFMFAY